MHFVLFVLSLCQSNGLYVCFVAKFGITGMSHTWLEAAIWGGGAGRVYVSLHQRWG